MKKYLKIYPRYLFMAVKSKLIYRLDALLGLLGLVVSNVASFLTLFLALGGGSDSGGGLTAIGGWSFMQIVFLYGFLLIPMGIDHMLTDRLWNYAGWLIVSGEMDRILMKPLNPLFQMCAEFFQEGGAGEVILGIAFMIIGGLNANIPMSANTVIPIVIGAAFSPLIYFAIKLATMSISFYAKQSISIMSAVYNVKDFGKYPSNIYLNNGKSGFVGNIVYNILLFILPFGLVGYLPLASQLFPNESIQFLWFQLAPGEYRNWLIMGIIVAISIIDFAIAYAIFKRGIKRYGSSGS